MLSQTNARIKSGGEQPQLYDTRILATRNASPGWAYNCDSTYKTFSSSTLPTLYNDMISKFNNRINIDSDIHVDIVDIDAIEGQIFNTYGSIAGSYFCLSKSYDLVAYAEDWSYVDPHITDILWRVPCGSGLFICGDQDYIYKSDKNSYNVIANVEQDDIDIVPTGYYDDTEVLVKVFVGIPEVAEGKGVCLTNSIVYNYNNRNIYITNDIMSQGGVGLTKYSFTGVNSIMDFEYVNGYWYILTESGNYNKGFCIYKGTSLSNGDFTDTTKWTKIYEANNDFFDNDVDQIKRIQLHYYNNKFYIFSVITKNEYNSTDFFMCCRYTTSSFTNISDIHSITLNGFYHDYTMRFASNYILVQTSDNVHYCSLDSIANSNCWGVKSLDVSTASQLSYPNEYNCMYVHDTNTALDTNKILYQIEIVPNAQIFTDKYLVNGSTISINYYLYNNFKMCTYDDLSILDTIYYYYNVSNYWNIIDGQISIPMNRQNYSVMYVGDNYINP